jgi:hypothetical protein
MHSSVDDCSVHDALPEAVVISGIAHRLDKPTDRHMRRLSRIAALGSRLLGTARRLRLASAPEHRRHAQILLA